MKHLGAIPNCLRSIRTTQELTIAALYVKTGVAPWLISTIEHHGLCPTATTREKLANGLGVEVHDIWPHLKQDADQCAVIVS